MISFDNTCFIFFLLLFFCIRLYFCSLYFRFYNSYVLSFCYILALIFKSLCITLFFFSSSLSRFPFSFSIGYFSYILFTVFIYHYLLTILFGLISFFVSIICFFFYSVPRLGIFFLISFSFFIRFSSFFF